MKQIVLSLFAISILLLPSVAFAQEPPTQIIDVGNSALHVKIVSDLAYVTNPADEQIIVIDTTNNQIKDTFEVGAPVIMLEPVQDQNRLYVTADGEAKVIVLDLTTGELIKEINFPTEEITTITKSNKPYGQREYVSFQTNGIGLAFNPNNDMLYAVNPLASQVKVIDTSSDSIVASIPVGKSPILIEIDEPTNIGYVTNRETNNVSVIDLSTNEVINTLNTGFIPDQMVIDNDNRRMFVTHHASPHVTIIDLRDQTIEDKIQLKNPTHAIAFDAKRSLIHTTYLPESGITGSGYTNMVEVIDSTSKQNIANFEINANPYTIDIDSDEEILYATIIKTGEVVAVDLSNDEIYLAIAEQAAETTPESNGGGCLIATAAFGTELAPQVQSLREIRDNTVMSTASGTAFMSGFNTLYYSFAPSIADMERENPMFKETVRAFITPMVSTLSIMSLADDGSESEVLGFGISVIALNLGMYIAAPALIGFRVHKYIQFRT